MRPCARTCALQVGSHLLARLRGLAAKHDIIGDVRGSGLMIGVELVKDRMSKVRCGAVRRGSTPAVPSGTHL